MAYATAAQLSAWPGIDDMPADAEALLRSASARVDRLLIGAVYDVDSDGNPTDATLAQAFADATCAQAAYMLDTGDLTGATVGLSSMTIGAISWGRGTGGGKSTAGVNPMAGMYAPDAIGALKVAGVLPVVAQRR